MKPKQTPEEKLYKSVERLRDNLIKNYDKIVIHNTHLMSWNKGQQEAYNKCLNLIRNYLGVGND